MDIESYIQQLIQDVYVGDTGANYHSDMQHPYPQLSQHIPVQTTAWSPPPVFPQPHPPIPQWVDVGASRYSIGSTLRRVGAALIGMPYIGRSDFRDLFPSHRHSVSGGFTGWAPQPCFMQPPAYAMHYYAPPAPKLQPDHGFRPPFDQAPQTYDAYSAAAPPPREDAYAFQPESPKPQRPSTTGTQYQQYNPFTSMPASASAPSPPPREPRAEHVDQAALPRVKILRQDAATAQGQLPPVIRLNPEARGALHAAWKRDLLAGDLAPDDDVHEAIAQDLGLEFVVFRGGMPKGYVPSSGMLGETSGAGKHGLIDAMFAHAELARERPPRLPTDEERRNLLAKAADRKSVAAIEKELAGSVNEIITAVEKQSSLPIERFGLVLKGMSEKFSPELLDMAKEAIQNRDTPQVALPQNAAPVQAKGESLDDRSIRFGPSGPQYFGFALHQEGGRFKPIFNSGAGDSDPPR